MHEINHISIPSLQKRVVSESKSFYRGQCKIIHPISVWQHGPYVIHHDFLASLNEMCVCISFSVIWVLVLCPLWIPYFRNDSFLFHLSFLSDVLTSLPFSGEFSFFWINSEGIIQMTGKVFLAIIYIHHFKSSYNIEVFKVSSTAIMAVFHVLIVTLCVWMWKEFRINLNSLKLYIALCLCLHSYFLFFPMERVQRFH